MVIPDVHVVIEVFLAVNGKVVKKGTSSAVLLLSVYFDCKKKNKIRIEADEMFIDTYLFLLRLRVHKFRLSHCLCKYNA